MRIAMLAASLSRAGGGIFDISRRMAQELGKIEGTDVCAVGLLDEHTVPDASLWETLPTIACPTVGPPRLGWAPGMRRVLDVLAPDVLHQHGIWRLPSRDATVWTRRTRRPLVVQVHGMLDTWALKNSALKKRVALLLYERAHLESAACLVANTQAEAELIRGLGLRNPIAVVPNGVDRPEDGLRTAPWGEALGTDRDVVLFLGRIHPKKGLENLLRAWKEVVRLQAGNGRRLSLVVTGWDDGGHEPYLHRLAGELGLSRPEIHFTGPLFGGEKDAALANAAAFILPSYSEGLPMAVLEALAHGVPVLKTRACNVPEAFAADAAIEIGTNVDSIRAGLLDMLSRSRDELVAMGDRGRQLVSQSFTWPAVARRMHDVYAWLIHAGDRPVFVV